MICTNLKTDIVSNDNAIMYARIKTCPSTMRTGEGECNRERMLAGVGCTISSVFTDAGAATRPGSNLKIEVKVDCGSVTFIKIQSAGSNYTGVNAVPRRPNQEPFGDLLDVNSVPLATNPWISEVKCTVPPQVNWYHSHELLEKVSYPKYNDVTHEIILQIDSSIVRSRGTAECIEMQFKFPIFNPIVAVDTNPAAVFPLNLTVSAKYEYTLARGGTSQSVVAPFDPPVIPDSTKVEDRTASSKFDVCNDAANYDLAALPRQNGDAVPMKIYAPDFLTANIGKSMPYPGAFNEISVTLMTNIHLHDTEHVLLTFMVGTSAPPHAPSLGGYFSDLSERDPVALPWMSGLIIIDQDVLTTSQTPSPGATFESTPASPNGYVNINGFSGLVEETALQQTIDPSNPQVLYYYGDYIECCSSDICDRTIYRETFKVLAYSKTTQRLRLRRQKPLRSFQKCYVLKTVFVQNVDDDPTFQAALLFGSSTDWVTNASSTDTTLNSTIPTGQILRGGHEYRFKFTVRNYVPAEPFITANNKGVEKVMIRVHSRSTAKDGLVKQRLEYAQGMRAKK